MDLCFVVNNNGLFAVDWKSTENAFTLLNPPNGDNEIEIENETFIDNCGLERDAQIVFLTFFEFLWDSQAAAF